MARTGRASGFTLLEVLISLAILLVGLIGMMRLHVLGVTSNEGARLHMRATQLARELANGLEALPFTDTRLDPTGGTTTSTYPSPFGSLLSSASGARAWSDSGDSTALPGVTLDAQLERWPGTAGPLYQRRWTVWAAAAAAGSVSAAKVVAVSVIYRERTLATPREVVLLLQRNDPGVAMSNAAAYR